MDREFCHSERTVRIAAYKSDRLQPKNLDNELIANGPFNHGNTITRQKNK